MMFERFLAAIPFTLRSHEVVRIEPALLPIPQLASIPDAVPVHPTTMVPQRAAVELMPVPAKPKKRPQNKVKSAAAKTTDVNAIRLFIEDWIDACGETVTLLDDLLRSYADLRSRHQSLPDFSKLKFSKLLAAEGCVRMVRVLPRDGRDERGKRLVVFEMRTPRRRPEKSWVPDEQTMARAA